MTTALLVAFVGGAPPPASAQERPAPVPEVKFTDYRLPNGLRVILSPDRSAPVAAISVTYNVGSRNERPGRTGFAHLFEHMMFQGSEGVGKGEHFLLIQNNGGTLNGTTSQDRTNYFAVLPANQLDLLLFLEADRMRSLDVSQANLDNQRAVVQEERRQRYDNQPYGQVQETLLDLAYDTFSYKHSTIGSMADLNAADLDDVRRFFTIYYAPNNAALALVGDFDVNEARQKIEKYFGAIPRQPAPPPVDVSQPPLNGERRKTLNDPLAPLPQLRIAYRTVPGDHPDFFALSVLGDILAGGRTTRLYPVLVEKDLATGVGAGVMESRGPSLFLVTANLPRGGKPEEIEAVIDREIARLQQGGVTAEEVDKVKTQARAAFIGGLESALSRANALSLYAVYYNDPNRINTELRDLQKVTAADVRRVAQKYLLRDNRVVITVLPGNGPAQPGGGTAPAGTTGTKGASAR